MSKSVRAALVIVGWLATAVLAVALNAPYGVLLVATLGWFFVLGYTARAG